ncbi:MAG: hypothetical protein OES12_11870, partial [Anaerolineae bacterium]|nr:hypothetical protein [Anaerolineae bacterium]
EWRTSASNVRFTPKSGSQPHRQGCPLCANTGHAGFRAYLLGFEAQTERPARSAGLSISGVFDLGLVGGACTTSCVSNRAATVTSCQAGVWPSITTAATADATIERAVAGIGNGFLAQARPGSRTAGILVGSGLHHGIPDFHRAFRATVHRVPAAIVCTAGATTLDARLAVGKPKCGSG